MRGDASSRERKRTEKAKSKNTWRENRPVVLTACYIFRFF
jgi:hypothetical protein